MKLPTHRRVARALRAGGPEVIGISREALPELKAGEALIRVEAAGLNHAETLIRSGTYVVRLPFPYATGGEGAGTVINSASADFEVGTRVCWGAVLGSCADYLIAPVSMLVQVPDELSFESAAAICVASLTAAGLARVWPLDGRAAVVWGAAGAVGRMLVAILAERGVTVIGIASGDRAEGVLKAGAAYAIDRTKNDVVAGVRSFTNGAGVAAVFDPVGAATFDTSLQLLAPRGCMINYGELSGAAPELNLHRLFAGSLFVTKFNGTRWVEGFHEFAGLILEGLAIAKKNPAAICDIAARFPLERAVEAYKTLELNPQGKILVLPQREGPYRQSSRHSARAAWE
jgi:NADPH2:quinone reductase